MDIHGRKVMNQQYTVSQGHSIILDTGPQRAARLLGKLRTKMCAEAGLITTTTAAGYDQEEINIRGVAGELAFAMMFNVCPDMTVNVRKGGADCRLPGDLYVDVKTSNYPTPDLMCNLTKRAADDLIFVQMHLDWPRVAFVGWEWSTVVIQPKYIRDTKNGERYIYPYDHLNQFL
jgi:hypothetical protein